MADDKEFEKARLEADQALAEAEKRRDVGSRLAEEWRESRRDNNFRLMLRRLGMRGYA